MDRDEVAVLECAWGITNWSDSLKSRIDSPPSPAPRAPEAEAEADVEAKSKSVVLEPVICWCMDTSIARAAGAGVEAGSAREEGVDATGRTGDRSGKEGSGAGGLSSAKPPISAPAPAAKDEDDDEGCTGAMGGRTARVASCDAW
jgi:hypothetical protein